MKEFQSVFRNELEEYLKINQGTVNEDTLRNTRRVLLSFDSSLAEENTNVISEAAVNRWIREIRQTNAAKTVSDKVSYLRKFLRYLQYKGYRVFMPDCPKTSDSYVPYIFSDEEIQILLARADSWATNIQTRKSVRPTWSSVCCCGCSLGAGSGWVSRSPPKSKI